MIIRVAISRSKGSYGEGSNGAEAVGVISRFALCVLLFLLWWRCCVGFSQRRGGAEVLPILYLWFVFWGFAFAEAVCVNFRLRLICSYVTLCGENFAQRRKARKGCGFAVVILHAFERCAFAKAVWVNFTLRLMFSFVPFVVKMCCVGFSLRRWGYARSMPVLCVLRLRFRRDCVWDGC